MCGAFHRRLSHTRHLFPSLFILVLPALTRTLLDCTKVLQLAIQVGQQCLRCFVIDLLAVDVPVALSPALGALFTAQNVTKLGFGWDVDLLRLCQSFPAAECFRTMTPLVDLGLVRLAGPRKGLSNLVEAVLGAPLEKSQQASDWGNRPLTRAQVLRHPFEA